MKKLLLSLTLTTFISLSLQITYCHNSFECSLNEECKSGICVIACNNKHCGEHAECESANHQAVCVCEENFIGNPLEKCWKIGENICDPNPCGNYSVCVAKDGRREPYCLCEENYYGKPPNCREGCADESQCESHEICNSHKCIDPCEKSPCGENSKCRNENHSKAICSCIDGFFPQAGLGCRVSEKKDLKVDVKTLESFVKNLCEIKCGKNAICSNENFCECSRGFKGDPKVECKLDNVKIDQCSPTPCGPYANCTIIENRPNCTCLDGYQGKPPFCSPCDSSSECKSDQICVNRKCVKNPCESFCGKSAECGVKDEKIECSCKKHLDKNPFIECPSTGFGPFSACDDVATKAECGVPIKEITKIVLAAG